MTVTGVITALARSSGVDLDGFLGFGLARLVAPRRHAQLGALVRGCGQAYALQTVAPVTYRCGTRRVSRAE